MLGMQRRAFTSKSSIVHKVVLTPQFVFCIDNNMDLSLQHQPGAQFLPLHTDMDTPATDKVPEFEVLYLQQQ